MLGNRTAAEAQVESSPSRHEVGMTHQPHCLCMSGATLETSADLGYPHRRGSLEHIKIQGNGVRNERIQRSTVHCPHAASASAASLGGKGTLQILSGFHQGTAASQCHSGLSILSPERPTLIVQKLKEGKGRAQQSLLQYLEKKKGPASVVLEEGVVPLRMGQDSSLCANRLGCYSSSPLFITIAENAHLLRATPSIAV